MTPARTHPLKIAAHQRLREQQHREAQQLAVVVRAEDALNTTLDRAENTAQRHRRITDTKKTALTDATVALVDISGITRAAALLGHDPDTLARLIRTHRKTTTTSDHPQEQS
jgi:hypothetical protein